MYVVDYERISRDPYNLSESIERQCEDNIARAAQLGLEISEHLIDHNRSAWKKNGKRPQFRRLLELIRAEQVDAVIIWDIDRLLRRSDDLEQLIDAVEEHPVPIYSARGEFDLTTTDGQYVARVLVAGAHKASDDTSRRVRRGLKGLPPRERSFAHDETNSDLVTWMVDELLAGSTRTSIAQGLNDDGYLTQRANPWTYMSVHQVIENPKVADIVGQDRYVAARRLLDNAKGTRPERSKHPYILSGLIECATCRRPMVGSGMTNRAGDYIPRYHCTPARKQGGCNQTMVAIPLEDAAKRWIRQSLIDGTLIITHSEVTTDDDAAKRLAELDRRFWVLGELTQERYDAIYAELEPLVRKTKKVTTKLPSLKEYDMLDDDGLKARLPNIVEKVVISAGTPGRRGFDGTRVTFVGR